jgi:Putative restriction endonuclease
MLSEPYLFRGAGFHGPLHLAAMVFQVISSREKMELWIENGAQLAWWIDPQSKSVTIYEKGQPARFEDGQAIRGTGPVEGFVLKLNQVWSAYSIKR